MNKNDTPENQYKKMSSGKAVRPARTKTNPKSNNATTQGRPQPKRKAQKDELRANNPGIKGTQILVIVLLSLIFISLSILIFFMIKPGKIQLWQTDTPDAAIIQRIDPVEEEPALKPEPEIIEKAVEAVEPKETETANMRETRIYFVKVNAEGQISLKSVNRNIDFSKSPLTQTINTLISGPGSDEINKGSLTLIPEGSRLLSARVEGGTAYLNFNEDFRFNPLGREGYLAQLKQVVYTSTEFPSIKNVQIMIEGVIREYLGGEGFYIGEALSRESFQNTP